MQMVYDIIGSMIIGGMILVMVLGFNANIMEGAGMQTFRTTVQGNMTTLTNILEYDFRKMGYSVATPQDSAIVYADTSRITIRGDFDDNGTIENITYTFNPTTPAGGTNPRTRLLTRAISGMAAQSINVGLTKFRLTYYDATGAMFAGNVVATPSKIRSIKVTLNIESREPYDKNYAGVYWERTIKPSNLD
jgi:hypothetical protein